jgi:hypothetical protein
MIVTLDVSGQIFKTHMDNLLKIPYFASMFDVHQYDGEVIFVDRSPRIFEHVLAYVRDDKHPYPKKYEYELDFYGITYDSTSLYDGNMVVKQTVDDLQTKLNKLYEVQPKCWVEKCKEPRRHRSLYCNAHLRCAYDGCNAHKVGCNYCNEHKMMGTLCYIGGCIFTRECGLVCYLHKR